MDFYNLLVIVMMILGISSSIKGEINPASFKEISKINNNGPYIGIVVPNHYELKPLLNSSSFVAHSYFDIAGRHFRIGELGSKKVIVVMSGLGMINAALATELLVTLFDVKGVLHHGIAGNLNSKFSVGDVVIPQYWAHIGQWHWQRFGDREPNEDFETKFGYIKFSDYNNHTNHSKPEENLLYKVWYEPERVYLVDGTPEIPKSMFWVTVDKAYYKVARKLKNFELKQCVINTTMCLPRKPSVLRVRKGVSANVFVNNKAFRDHLKSNFDATPTDMESAAVALVCYQHKLPFIAFRALSDLAGAGSSTSEIFIYLKLVSHNAFNVLLKFISLI